MNTATKLLRHIGGTAAAMLDATNERIVIRAAEKQEAIDNPPEKRIAQPLRSYLKRYRNNIAEYIIAVRGRRAAVEAQQS